MHQFTGKAVEFLEEGLPKQNLRHNTDVPLSQLTFRIKAGLCKESFFFPV